MKTASSNDVLGLQAWVRSENQAKNGRLAFQREVPLVTRPLHDVSTLELLGLVCQSTEC